MGAIFSELLIQTAGGGINVATLTDDYTVSTALDGMSAQFHQLTPSGANRNFILPDPSEGLVGCFFIVGNDAASGGYSVPVRGKTLTAGGTLSSVSTIGTLAPGMMALSVCYWDGTYWRWSYKSFAPAADLTLTGILTAAGIINSATVSTGTALSNTAAITGAGNAMTVAANPSGATASPDAVVIGLTQTTNNRSSGTATALDITVTGRAGDVGGTYEAIRGTAALNGGSATAIFAKVAAGFSNLFDLSSVSTGEADDVLGDNLANARGWRVGASTYLMKVVTTTGAKIVQFAQGIGADSISEVTSAAGVTVDGCLIKDGRAALLATAGMFSSTEQTGTGSSQNVAHGFGAAPSMWWAVPTDTTAGWVVSAASQDATNISITVTTGAKFRVYALK